ncbi:C-type lectin domain-containing protein [Sorangium sp. So ce406]|uniref:C-type lectin domain-containing protein n=1 Tax=Sorangium sp. So ce406 TaxID=3133311 RepID=UPI003F5B700A
MVACGSADHQDLPSTGSAEQPLITQWSVLTPVGSTPQSTVLSATERLKVDARVHIGTTGELETIASFGNTLTEIGASVVANANLFSKAPLNIAAQADVVGFAHSAGSIQKDASADVIGGAVANTPIPSVTTRWSVNFPDAHAGNRTVNLDTTLSLDPGAYGNVDLRPRSKLLLRTGTYFFESFTSEPDAQVSLDVSAGPVFVYVRAAFTLKAPFVAVGGDASKILVGTLGSGTVLVNSPLLGTLVAPNAAVELNRPSNNQPHRGAVFARRIEVFSDVPLLHVPFTWPQICPQGDSDLDGLNDCQEACPDDPAKVSPGLCGCGKPETDSDGDGAPDCVDGCAADPVNVDPGTCGCAGEAQPGAACSDRICGGEFTCNADGTCGDPEVCSPDPGHCVPRKVGDTVYWLCAGGPGGGPKTRAQADAACASLPGRTLARIDSRAENELVARLISSPSWTAANELAVDGQWRWGTGDMFFSNGAAVDGRYVNWRSGDPVTGDAARCGAILPGSGQWFDENCSQPLGYVCENREAGVDPDAGPTAPPITCQSYNPNDPECEPDPGPPSAECVPSSTMLPAEFAEFQAQVEACREMCTSDDDPDCPTACVGAATVPPPSSRCEPMALDHCQLVDITNECVSNSDCTDGRICGTAFSCNICASRDASGNCVSDCEEGQSPVAELRCGRPEPDCDLTQDPDERCEQVELCPEPGAIGTSSPYVSPATDLTLEPFDPSVFGTPPAPATAYPADPACAAPPCAAGPSHPWCTYEVADTTQEKLPDAPPKHGRSGEGSMVTFDFDPNLTLRFDATPLALGEARLDLEASAAFRAAASFDLPGIPHGTLELIDALASARAERCRIWTSDSKLEVFGVDYLPSLVPGLLYDSAVEEPDFYSECTEALDLYEKTVSRAKKAMKDAQELVRQYNQLKANGFRFDPALCQQIASDPPFGFPPGDCSTDSVEETINRFIRYYYERVDSLIQEQRALATKVLHGEHSLTLNGPQRTHNVQLFTANFAIGPIPMNLEVDATAGYGLTGNIDFELNPSTFLGTGSEEKIANVRANAEPYAFAGVGLFVGVGFDAGPLALKAGVRGDLKLGRIDIPFRAGAGIRAKMEDDPRPLPVDLQEISGGLLRVQPKQYKFSLAYEYGADVRLTEILKGTIYGQVKVSFLFFSKVWKKTLLHYPGFSAQSFRLFGGEGEDALGALPWATVQMPLPFVDIQLLPDAPPAPNAPVAPFDGSQVEELFYDSLCTCREQGEPCYRPADCCVTDPGYTCLMVPGNDVGTCGPIIN